jgi:hypothetical protein
VKPPAAPVITALAEESWNGEFLTTAEARTEASEDFGRVVAHQALAVLRPALRPTSLPPSVWPRHTACQ